MSESESKLPPVGEEIHLPGPSLQPLLIAVGLSMFLVGLTTIIEVSVIGFVILVISIAKWIKGAREEFEHLPPA